jgi:hypothetical protein
MLLAFEKFLGTSDMLAYLGDDGSAFGRAATVLKPTGSLFLHCDPTASHYLKLLLDAVFGPERILNEIIWNRTSAQGDASQRFAGGRDDLATTLRYTHLVPEHLRAVVEHRRGIEGQVCSLTIAVQS